MYLQSGKVGGMNKMSQYELHHTYNTYVLCNAIQDAITPASVINDLIQFIKFHCCHARCIVSKLLNGVLPNKMAFLGKK